jgi:hypothetical protein
MKFIKLKGMELRNHLRSYFINRFKRVIQLTLFNTLPSCLALFLFVKSNLEMKIKLFQILSCEMFSHVISVMEIYGERTNAHLHFTVFFYTFLQLSYFIIKPYGCCNMCEFVVIIGLFGLKAIFIEKLKDPEINSSEVLKGINLKIKVFKNSKKTYSRLLSFLILLKSFVSCYFSLKNKNSFPVCFSVYLLGFLYFLVIFPLKDCFLLEIVLNLVILISKGLFVIDKREEFDLFEIFSVAIVIIYIFYIFLTKSIGGLILEENVLK